MLTPATVAKDDDTPKNTATSLITQTFDTRRNSSTLQLDPRGGRPDMKAEIWNWVMMTTTGPSQTSSSSSSSVSVDLEPVVGDLDSSPRPRKEEKLCVVVSGPDGLVRDVRNVVAQLVRDGWDIEVWVEKFGW